MKYKRALKNHLLFLYFGILSLVYFLSSSGVATTNDGSHFGLVQAMVERRSFEISKYVHLTFYPEDVLFENTSDISVHQGRYYSDRPPGTAFLAVPFYLLGRLVGLLEGRPELAMTEVGATSLSAFAAALSTILIYRIALLLGARASSALITSLAWALATLQWKYATTLFSHSLSTSFILLACYLALRAVRGERPSRWLLLGLGGSLGYSILVEYINAFLALAFLHYLDVKKRLTRQSLFPLVISFLTMASLLPLYNYLAFGEPMNIPYSYQAAYAQVQSPFTTFTNPLLEGVRGLLFGDARPMLGSSITARGLMQTSPLLILSLWGWFLMLRRQKDEALLFAGLFLMGLFVAAQHFSWYGDQDTRYILTVIPYILLPLFSWLDGVMQRFSLAGLIFWPLFLVSAWESWRMVMIFEGHYADARPLGSLIPFAREDPGGALRALLPGLGYLWIWVVGLSIIFLLYMLFSLKRWKLKEEEPKPLTSAL